jgi:hypothetical protein
MKENLNKKVINKPNLLSTWTKQKISSFILLTLVSIGKVKAGSSFKSCLSAGADAGTNVAVYNSLVAYGFTNETTINDNNILKVCSKGTYCFSHPLDMACVGSDAGFGF